ncbi:hypothetical protein WJX81_002213 [Elliptochloris bilobata]|uniref:START domain-containing protein n=1 Tax=Elliptochloris bilobata TaxID=381761 RepID=A0AAW1SDQ2_9CHLO
MWHPEVDNSEVKVYSRPEKGTELVVIRAIAIVDDAEPDPLFTFFTSKAGFKVIDPACTNHDDPPFREWSEREEVAYSRAPMQPPVRPRTFLVANIVDPAERLFVSKSILDDALPPGDDGAVRAVNSFVLRTGAAPGGGSSLEILDYVDLRGDDCPVQASNTWHVHSFVPEMLQRLRAEIAAGALDAGRML